MKQATNLIGQRFGRLVVLERAETKRRGVPRWICLCDCGNEIIVIGANLRNGNTQSCGCLMIERTKEANTTHGHARRQATSKEYTARLNFISRCYNPKDIRYPNYGGRGIRVCQRWLESFENFFEDVGFFPEDKSFDRMDNNGHYEPTNWKFSDDKEQANNRTSNHIVEFQGEKLTVTQWSEKTGIPYGTILYRLKKEWSIEKTLTTPVRKQGKTIVYQDREWTLAQLAQEFNIDCGVLNARLNCCNWPLEKALFTPVRKRSRGSK